MFGSGGQGFLHFSVFGIPVSLDWSFLLVPLLAMSGGWQRALIWTGVVFVSVLLHELGHALAMKVFGFEPRVSLYALGGLTFWPENANPSVKQSFVVSGAGPAVSISLGLISLVLRLVAPAGSMATELLNQSIWVNLFWGVINLLPLMPLDGGNLLDTGATIITGTPRPRWVGLVSIVFGVGVAAGAFKFGQPFLGLLGVFAVMRGWNRWSDQRPDFDATIRQATELGWSGKGAEAEQLLRMLETAALDDAQRSRVREAIAWVRIAGGDVSGAEAAVRTMPAGWQVSPELRARLLAANDDVEGVISTLLPEVTNGQLPVTAAPLLGSALVATSRFAELEAVASLMLANAKTREDGAGRVAADLTARLFRAGQPEACLRLCEFLWKKFHKGEDAFNSACSLVKLNRNDEAMVWLADAVKAGMPELKKALLADDDVAPLRARPEFQALVERAQ